ncbi:hypothetical protein IWW38_001927, partial [Coemansia aciculifera]
SRMVKLNETAEARIATAIERYGGEIDDPAIREVWEQQLREDVMEKVNRIKDRQKCCSDLLRQAKERELNPDSDDGRRRHSPILALYLYTGERCLDWLILWMRGNKHFCYEPGDVNNMPGSVSLESLMGGCENGPSSAPSAHKRVIDEEAAAAVARSSPVPFIAVAQSVQQPHSFSRSESMPEPSAPVLSESQFLKLVPPPPTIPPLADYETESNIRVSRDVEHTSDQVLRYETLEPPPYSPVSDSDAELDSEPGQKTRKQEAIVADNNAGH